MVKYLWEIDTLFFDYIPANLLVLSIAMLPLVTDGFIDILTGSGILDLWNLNQ